MQKNHGRSIRIYISWKKLAKTKCQGLEASKTKIIDDMYAKNHGRSIRLYIEKSNETFRVIKYITYEKKKYTTNQ